MSWSNNWPGSHHRRRPGRHLHHLALVITALFGSFGTIAALSTAADASTSAVSFSATSYVSGNTAAVWTVTFTAATAFGNGDYIDVQFPGSFDLTNAVATLGTGFTGCTAGTIVPEAIGGLSPLDIAQIPLNGSCAATTGSPDTLTITGINPTAVGPISRSAFAVGTYTDAYQPSPPVA